MLSVGFLGFGNMAKAIYRGIKIDNPNQLIYLYDINAEQYKNCTNDHVCNNVNEFCEAADIIFLCVKPSILPNICKEITVNDKAFVSIAAGTAQEYLNAILPETSRVVRIMPNTPLMVNKGMVCIQTPNSLNKTEEKFITELFSRIGKVIKINGKDMDIVTGISGSGPAYVYLFIEAMIISAVNNGISKESAKELVLQTFEGACEMLRHTGKSPAQLIKDVCSPNGTTLAAIEVLKKYNIPNIIEQAVEAAAKRSKEISQTL